MTEVAWTPQQDGDEPRPYRSEIPQPPVVDGRPLRIGDRVRYTGEDSFIPCGMTGLVTNTRPAMGKLPAQAMILWDNETGCRIAVSELTRVERAVRSVHPVVMGAFGRSV